VKEALREIACVMCLNWVHTIEYNERLLKTHKTANSQFYMSFLDHWINRFL